MGRGWVEEGLPGEGKFERLFTGGGSRCDGVLVLSEVDGLVVVVVLIGVDMLG